MDLPTRYFRHTLIWTLPGGEVAQCRIHWWDAEDPSFIPDGFFNGRVTAATTFWNAIKDLYPTTVTFVGSRVQNISPAGLVLETREDLGADLDGTGTNPGLPHQLSVVVTTLTDNAGKSGRGRFYLPPPELGTVTADGRFATAGRDDIAAAAANLLDVVTTVDFTVNAVVASTALGVFRNINAVKVGDVFDNQRRRRNELVESYKVEPVSV